MKLFLSLACLALVSSGETKKPGVRITGHVYRADSHKPFDGVTLTLIQVGGAVVAHVQTDVFSSVQTAADGSYSFNTAPLYQMFVGAGKPGFVMRFYFLERRKPVSGSWLMRNPIRAAGKLVTLTPGSKLNGLDFFLRPKPEIAQMPDAPLTQAHSAVRQHLRFRYRMATETLSYDLCRSEVLDDKNAPATKGDLANLEEKFDQKFDQLRAEMNHGYADLAERMHDSETRLLKAFYDFAQSNQRRMTEIETSESSMRSRLATIEDRLLQVEKRLNMPPAA